jgi:parallel beta-helix repeat protein
MVWNDRFVLHVSRKWQGEYIDAGKVYLSGSPKQEDWDGIEVLFSSQGGSAWVRSRNGEDPNRQEVTIAPHCYDIGGGTVNLRDANHVILRGFVIKGGDTGVYMANSTDNVIERNVIQHGKNGVLLHYGSHRNVIRDNYITMRTFGTMNRFKATSENIQNVVRIVKGDGRRDHQGILLLYAGHDNEFCYNTIFEHWDGVKACVYMTSGGDKEVVAKEKRIQSQLYARGFKVHHNIIRDCWDYGIEPCGGEVDAEYHHNLLHDTYGSRIKSIGTGPAYFYKNFYACPSRGIAEIDERRLDPLLPPRSQPAACCFYISNENDCLLYVYHNTFAGLGGINLADRLPRYSENWWFINNICSNSGTPLSAKPEKVRLDYHLHHSYLSAAKPRGIREDAIGNLVNPKLLWEPGTPGMFSDFRIGKDWPVREKGIDLSQPWQLDGVKHPALPGLEKGYFSGTAPDLGALQFGEDMPQVGPRW